MSSAVLQLLVLAVIAVVLILRLRSVLGTRDGFEGPPAAARRPEPARREALRVIPGGAEDDIADFVDPASDAGRALAAMKAAEPEFSVAGFLDGAKAAYEWILMAFERGDIEEVRPWLDPEVAQSFDAAIAERRAQGLEVEATFLGLRDVAIHDAHFDPQTAEAEITVRFVAELSWVVRDAEGRIVDGDPHAVKRVTDIWTFARRMGVDDPNWILVATGE